MTTTQQEDRHERIAIMTADGIPEHEAQAYCDSRPEIYGLRAEGFTQAALNMER